MMAQFKRGTFAEYRATEKIHLGKHGVDIMRDDIVEYDGITLKMGPDEFNTTLLRKAINKGWLVPATDTESVYVPQPSGVTVGPAETGNPMDYKNKKRLAANSHEMDVDSMSNEGAVVVTQGFTDFSDPANKNKTQGRPGAGRRMQVETLDQEGEVVASIGRAPSKHDKLVVDNSQKAAQQIRRLENTPIKRRTANRVSGSPQPQIDTSGLSPEEAAVLKKLLAKAGGGEQPAPARQEVGDADHDPEVRERSPWVGKTKEEIEAAKAQAEAERAARLAGMGVDPGDKNARNKQVAVPVEDEDTGDVKILDEEEPEAEMDMEELLSGEEPPDADDIEFDESGDGEASSATSDEEIELRMRNEKLKMVQAMFPGFDWNFEDHWRTRVSTACKEHYGKPTLQAIKQIETDAVVKFIEQYEEKMSEG